MSNVLFFSGGDFRGFSRLLVSNTSLSSDVTFTRSTTGTYFDVSGVLQTAAIDVPRFDHLQDGSGISGLLIEESGTNDMPNSTMVGAGVSTFPTGWGGSVGSGITRNILGTGTVNGMEYLDIQYVGTSGSGSTGNVFMSGNTDIAALDTETFTSAITIAVIDGSLTNIDSVKLSQSIRDGGGSSISSDSSADLQSQLSADFARIVFTNTLSDATAAYIRPDFDIAWSSGNAIDVTFRITTPQTEEMSFATSFIPTTAAAATRTADVASIDLTAVSWFNATEGTLYCDAVAPNDPQTSLFVTVAEISGNAAADRVQISRSSGAARGFIKAASVTVASLSPGSWSDATRGKSSLAYKVNDYAMSFDGGSVATDTSGALPTGLDVIRIGFGTGGGEYFNGIISSLGYYDTRLSDAQLELLTT